MDNEIILGIISEIKREVSYWRFLVKYKLNKNEVLDSVANKAFYYAIKDIVEEHDYTCVSVISVFSVASKKLFDYVPNDNFLNDIYNYTLRKSFPESIDKSFVIKEEIYEFYLIILKVVNNFQKKSKDESFMSIYPLDLLSDTEVLELEDSEEYLIFKNAFLDQNIYEMMKLNFEVTRHSTIQHILGVHQLALFIARQVKILNIPIDLGRVSAAAAGHDIGKFACTESEKDKVAHYHYFYTNEWFEKLNLKYSKNVAVYHSTWDLELENLSLESLILIYSDFCVKRSSKKEGLFKMKFLSVEESYEIILSKLENISEFKKQRYDRVYQKLKNFSEYLVKLGVDITVLNYHGNVFVNTESSEENSKLLGGKSVNLEYNHFYSLNKSFDIVENLKFMSIDKSIRLMHSIRDESSLSDIIQDAMSEKDIQKFRRYIFIFQEYSTYLTPAQKLLTIDFLEEYLLHSEEDIRKKCSTLIGKLIAFYNENYTKELPKRARIVYSESNKVSVIKRIIDKLIFPEIKMTHIKRERLANGLHGMTKSLFDYCEEHVLNLISDLLVSYLSVSIVDRYSILFLLDSLTLISLENIGDKKLNDILFFIFKCTNDSDEEIKVIAIGKIDEMFSKGYNKRIFSLKDSNFFKEMFSKCMSNYNDFSLALKHFCRKLNKELCDNTNVCFDVENVDFENKSFSEIYLSNLKSATPKFMKIIQIELLYQRSLNSSSDDKFYTAMHYCNILKVSAHESVRNTAGKHMLQLFVLLSSEQKNDIVVELARALEIEGYGFTRYIPDFLGRAILDVNKIEYEEILDDMSFKISNAGVHVRILLLKTIGTMIKVKAFRGKSEKKDLSKLIGYLFRGFFSGNKLTSQIVFNIISKDLIGNVDINLATRFELFKLLFKKINIYIMDMQVLTELDYLNYSVGLNYIYKFISDYSFLGEMHFEEKEKVAFYNGTFDPFSLGQKKAAIDTRDLDMEVYIAISEFRWKRRTQPSLMRRQIVEMSIADSLDIYAFPSEISINLNNEKDLAVLRRVFKGKEVFMIVGEETLLHDSIYSDLTSSVYSFPHIVFKRNSITHSAENKKIIEARINNISAQVITKELEYKYEMIDPEQIRRNIDNNWDAYDVIDDLARKFIIDHNIYKNEPKFKEVIPTNDLIIEVEKLSDCKKVDYYCKEFNLDKKVIDELYINNKSNLDRNILTIKDESTDEVIALSIYTKARLNDLDDELDSSKILEKVRNAKNKKILLLDFLCKKTYEKVHAIDQIILTESIAMEIKNDCTFAIVKDSSNLALDNEVCGVLQRSGFVRSKCDSSNDLIYTVDMSSPVVLNLDGTTRMKSSFRQNQALRDTIKLVRSNLQQAIVNLYPGQLVLSFDRSMIYNHIVRHVKISSEKENSDSIVVPYGDIFKRWVLPNVITKSLHTERYFTPNLDSFEVKAYPWYLSIENQANVLKSFNKPVILIDDLYDKGNRLRIIEKNFEEKNIKIDKVIVGILSNRGKIELDRKKISILSAYYIPNIKVWFNESDLYPFVGGDSLYRERRDIKSLLISTNLILPFSYPKYIKGVSKKDLYDFSEVCLNNSYVIFSEIEKLYLKIYRKNLAIRNLKEVMITPRAPDIGSYVFYDMNYKPTDYLKNEMERLEKMKPAFEKNIANGV